MARVALALLLLALPHCARAQRPLAWSELALNQVYTLAQGLDREVVLCGAAKEDGDSLRVTSLTMPYMRLSDTADTRADACPSGTVVLWHNHPWTGPDPAGGYTAPAELCSLSRTDRSSGRTTGMPWIAVSVGRADPRWTWLCWWGQAQLDSGGVSLPALVGQRLKFWTE